MKTTLSFARFATALPAAALLAALIACNSPTGGDVMATVDGRKILRTDVDKYYDSQVASAQQAPTGEQATCWVAPAGIPPPTAKALGIVSRSIVSVLYAP